MTPKFLFDVASPNSYFVHRVLPEVEARLGRRFDYVPVLLGGLFKLSGNTAPMIAFAGVPAKLAYERTEIGRFIARHDLNSFRMNPHFPINTVAPMRVIVAAQQAGEGPAAIEALMRFMWEEPRNLGDPMELVRALDEAGLDAERLIAASAEEPTKQALKANTEQAFAMGAFGVPSFLVGDQLWFGKERLGEVEQAIAEA